MASPKLILALATTFALGALSTFLGVTCTRTPTNNGAATTSAMAATPAPAPAPPSVSAAPPAVPEMRTEDERNTIEVFRRAANSAVFVTQRQLVVDYFNRRALEVPAGAGSGFVWDKLGHVVTNFHVIRGAKKLTVTLHDQKTYPAQIVGAEPRKDIAVLRINAPASSLVPIAYPKGKPQIDVGEKVIAIGNPFGLDQTLTTGVVSALGREVDGIGGVTIREMVQTDAAINPGNSGGPLLDSSARLIGMNTQILSRTGASAGIGFAVHVTTILRVVPQIIRTGRAEQVGIGVEIDPERRLEQRNGIRGMIVLRVSPGTPADRAGLIGLKPTPTGTELGDVIIEIDGKKIEDYDDLYNTLDAHRPGDRVKFVVLRDGKRLEKVVELIVLP